MAIALGYLHKIRWITLIALLLCVPLLVDQRIGSLGPESKFRLLELGVLMVILLGIPSFLIQRSSIKLNLLNGSIILFTIYILILAWFDPFQSYAFDMAFQQAAWLLFILALASVCKSPADFRKFLWIAIPIQLICIAYAFGQIYGVDIYIHWIEGKTGWRWYNPTSDEERNTIIAPLGQPNYYANYGAIVLLFLFTLLAQARTVWSRIILFALSAFMLITLFYTYTRGIWVSIIPAIGFIAGLELIIQLTRNRGFRSQTLTYLKPAIAFASIAVVLLGMYSAFELYRGEGPLHKIGKRFYHGITFRDTSMRSRPLMWYASLRMWKEAPLFGQGVGQFAPNYLDQVYHTAQEYDPFIIHEVTKQMNTLRVDRSHNDYLHTLAELGMVGLSLLLLMLLASTTIPIYILWNTSLSPPDRVTLLGCLTVVVQTAVQLIYDFPLHLPASAMFFGVAVAGVLVYCRIVSPLNFTLPLHPAIRWFAVILFIPLWFCSCGLVAAHFQSSHLRNAGINALNQAKSAIFSNPLAAIPHLNSAEAYLALAYERFPHDGFVLQTLGETHFYFYQTNPSIHYAKLNQARAFLEQARQTFNGPDTIKTLCSVYIEQKRYDKAANLSNRLLAIDPTRAQAQYLAGLIAFKAGRFSQAIQHFNNELNTPKDDEYDRTKRYEYLSRMYIAQSLIGLKQHHAAADALESIINEYPNIIEPRGLLAELYETQLNERIKARGIYQTILNMVKQLPEPDRTRESKKYTLRLNQLQGNIDQELNRDHE